MIDLGAERVKRAKHGGAAPKSRRRPTAAELIAARIASSPAERTDEVLELERFHADESYKLLSDESMLANERTKHHLIVEALVLHERLLSMRALASIGKLTTDEARSMPGIQGKLLHTYRMLRVDQKTKDDDPL